LILNNCIVTGNVAGVGGDSYEDDDPGIGGVGGGIWNSGILTLNNCAITGNRAGKGGDGLYFGGVGGHGGGIYNTNTLNINNCTISNNKAGDSGLCDWNSNCGYSGNGGGIYNNGNLNMQGCTINANVTGSDFTETIGGGIYNDENANLTMIACTISGNEAGMAGGLYNEGKSQLTGVTVVYNSSGGIYNYYTMRLKNCICADNRGGSGHPEPDCAGGFYWVGYCLIKDTQGCTFTGIQKANILGEDPLLGPLADNGGPTETHALLPGSPAIDAGNSSNLYTDQRGFKRPINIPGIADVSDGADIGAYEFNASYSITGSITYNGIGLSGVTLTFSNNGGSTTTGLDGHYSHTVLYNWSGSITPTKEGYTFTPSGRNYTPVITDKQNQDYTASSLLPPQISLTRSRLNFGTNIGGKQTGPQSLLIANSGGGILKWTAAANTGWLNCTPASGTGSAVFSVAIDPAGLTPGNYAGTITIADPNAVNSPQTINVALIVYDAGSTDLPFGSFDSPVNGAVVSGSIPVTGWAIDNIGVESVKIYRNPATGEGHELLYIGDAIFVEGARPDIVLLYPDYPNNSQAGWGYMLLTNALPGQGNGAFTLYAKAVDKEGNTVILGSKNITCDNAHAVKPFGAIDTPAQGGPVSGSDYVNHGWALTPLPNTIPTAGSTITVWVDGVSLGHPSYNNNRPDVAALFPNYNNSDGAGGLFHLDTMKFANGVHTIAWTAVDNAGNADGIGSRYFTVQNPGQNSDQCPMATVENAQIPFNDSFFISVKKGFAENSRAEEIYPVNDGGIHIEIGELERVEIQLAPGTINVSPLPIGSTLDVGRGIFYWQPGPGFIGDYEFIFLAKARNGKTVKTLISVKINPKSHEGGEIR
ncbi:MAG TPA: choice-of-anchor Q domain-containing protein, partial [Candidatus Deferrimicrobium sp.]|nr:choice-of-anchor Q domain-containing protein [Candidatus Deferrimicrobium sp.]